MDSNYCKNDIVLGMSKETIIFRQALYVHATVIHASGGKRILDAGSKATVFDREVGLKVVAAFDKELDERLQRLESPLYAHCAGDEHAVIHGVSDGLLSVGSKMQLVPSDMYATVNLHDYF